MSKSQNQDFQFWQDVLDSLGRIPSVREGIELTNRDSETLSQVIVMNAMILIDTDEPAPRRDLHNLKRWCLSTKRLDVAILDNMMKEIVMQIRTSIAIPIESFKRSLSCSNQDLGAFMAPVYDILLEHLQCPNAGDFTILNQFVSFMTRTTLVDVNFQDECLEDYYANEVRLGELSLDSETVDAMRKILHKWMKPFRIGKITPRHGPGGTAFKGRQSAYDKHHDVFLNHRLAILNRDTPNFCDYITVKRGGKISNAEVVFVPKNLSTMRTICMEPTSLMYYQQGVWDNIDKYMSSHPVLKKTVQLHDQNQNRIFSWIGSMPGDKYATIDLSAASDSVTWELVKRVFSGTEYHRACLLTRSSHVDLPDGHTMELKKFAPMGSTLCFPTQCLIYASLCEYVVKKNGGRLQDAYSVFGDDIVILREFAHELCDLLRSVGFQINESKSYLQGRFKESCGGEYYDGEIVTPIKITRKYTGQIMNNHEPSLFTRLIEMINACEARGYRSLRTYLISKFEVLPKNLLPIFDDGTKGIQSTAPTNFHLKSWRNRYLQSYYFKHGEPRTGETVERIDDDTSLMMWYFRAEQRNKTKYAFMVPEDLVVVRTAPETQLVRSVSTFDPVGSEQERYLLTLKYLSERSN